MKAGIMLGLTLTLTVMALLWTQGAITTQADAASTALAAPAQITFYVR
jgi:hypothetical protein